MLSPLITIDNLIRILHSPWFMYLALDAKRNQTPWELDEGRKLFFKGFQEMHV
jgi:hypothetical protein